MVKAAVLVGACAGALVFAFSDAIDAALIAALASVANTGLLLRAQLRSSSHRDELAHARRELASARDELAELRRVVRSPRRLATSSEGGPVLCPPDEERE